MRTKATTLLGVKVIILTVVLLSAFIGAGIISGVSGTAGSEASSQDAGAVLPALLIASFLHAVVFTYIILRSRWSGWKLVGVVFVAFYGLMTVVTQIESIVFLPEKMPPGTIPKLFLMGALMAALFSPLAVLILGKMKRRAVPRGRNLRLVMPPSEWAWKLAVIAVGYLVLYFGFGYFVAWKNPQVREYYGGTDPGSFFAQMAAILEATPWMFSLQVFRAMLWVAFVLPVIRMLRGARWEVTLAVGLLFAVWSSMLLLPNPYMPEAVSRTHLVETAPSNFLFGLLVGFLLSRQHRSVRGLLPMTNDSLKRDNDRNHR